VRIAAGLGLALCAYLAVAGIRSSGPAGCDPSAGCGELLSGRWSAWFGLPVSLPASLVYLGIFLSSRFVKCEDRAWRFRPAGRMLAMTTALAAASAIWFLLIHAAEKAVCPYCLAVHACGLLAAGLVWRRLRRWPRELLKPAGAGLAILVLGQSVVFRHPYRVQADVVVPRIIAQPTGEHAAHVRISVEGRIFDLDPEKLPVLGSPHARHFIVLMSDYTCEHCRVTHRMIERTAELRDEQVGVIVLPVLLDPAGNPFLPRGATHPMPKDCALTRLALAVYCAKPAAFAEMNRWLFAADRVRNEAEAQTYAERLVGPDALRDAQRDPRIQQITLAGCELFARTGNGMLPKMRIGSMQISGAVDDENALSSWIGTAWSAGPPAGP
jgi:uncharacterized membrane protein